jgi:hypothetical protein
VAHALAADNTARDELTVFIDGGFTAANALVLGIVWVDVFDWAKDTLTEKAIAFWFLGTVVDGFWLQNLTVTPVENIFALATASRTASKSAIFVPYEYRRMLDSLPFFVVCFGYMSSSLLVATSAVSSVVDEIFFDRIAIAILKLKALTGSFFAGNVYVRNSQCWHFYLSRMRCFFVNVGGQYCLGVDYLVSSQRGQP